MSKFIFKLGVKAKDIITGFEGIITGRADHITGCNTYGLKPRIDKDGKVQESEWFDEGTIEVIAKGITEKKVKAEENGGPLSENPRG